MLSENAAAGERRGLSSFALHLLAMLLMLCDHLWATVIPGNMWLTNLGRAAFPLFAFLLVEGFFHTKNLRRYLLRLLCGAVISEIPFNLMYGGSVVYPYHQNIYWTLLLSLLCVAAAEKLKSKYGAAGIAAGVLIFGAGALLALACMLDYYGFGVLTVAAFYYFRGEDAPHRIAQLLALYVIHVKLLGGMVIDVSLAGHTFEVVQQGFALFAMVPVCLYDGRQGPHGKGIRAFFYLFYPVHMLILSLLALRL